jgi:hypothetical protein
MVWLNFKKMLYRENSRKHDLVRSMVIEEVMAVMESPEKITHLWWQNEVRFHFMVSQIAVSRVSFPRFNFKFSRFELKVRFLWDMNSPERFSTEQIESQSERGVWGKR